jgi:hypothetical protein
VGVDVLFWAGFETNIPLGSTVKLTVRNLTDSSYVMCRIQINGEILAYHEGDRIARCTATRPK